MAVCGVRGKRIQTGGLCAGKIENLAAVEAPSSITSVGFCQRVCTGKLKSMVWKPEELETSL